MADWTEVIGLLGAAYLLGCVSFAFLAGRALKGVDIRSVGSHNAGALNVFREIGRSSGIIVLLLDAAKGAAIVGLAQLGGFGGWALYLAPVALVAGHNWPIWLGFRGGRGLAPVVGVSLAMLPLRTVFSALPAAVTIAVSRSVVFGAAVGLTMVNSLTLLTGQENGLILSCGVLTAIVALTHFLRRRRNYKRALRERDWTAALRVE